MKTWSKLFPDKTFENRASDNSISGLGKAFFTVEVGPEAQKFRLHRDVFCRASPYFDRAFEVKIEEGKTLIITLEDVSVRTFQILQIWLYSGRLLLPRDSDAYLDPIDPAEDATMCDVCGDPLEDVGPDSNWPKDILDLYIVAYKYDFPLFRRDIMIECQHLSEILSACVPVEVVIQAYKNLPKDSPFIDFLIQEYKLKWQPKELHEECACQKQKLAQIEKGEIPYHFTIQVMIQSHHRNGDPMYETGKVDWCEFHEHNSWAEAEQCRAKRLLNGRHSENEFLDESELLLAPSEVTQFREYESEALESV